MASSSSSWYNLAGQRRGGRGFGKGSVESSASGSGRGRGSGEGSSGSLASRGGRGPGKAAPPAVYCEFVDVLAMEHTDAMKVYTQHYFCLRQPHKVRCREGNECNREQMVE